MPMDARSLKLLTDESHENDRSAVFEQLFADVSSAFDTFHEDVDKSTFSSISGLEDEVKIEHAADKGLAVTFRVHKKLPFSLEAVSNGMWRFIGLESPALPAYYKREVRASLIESCGQSHRSDDVWLGCVSLFFAARCVDGESSRAELWHQIPDPIRHSRLSLPPRRGAAVS